MTYENNEGESRLICFVIERISQKSNTQLIKYEEMGESENRDV